MQSLISVCIPAYNEEKTIRRTLESVAGQELGGLLDLEILVGPNGCTDRTEDEVLSFGEQCSFAVRVVDVDGKGKPTAWNALVAAASAEVLCFLDADVELDKNALLAVHQDLQDHQEVVAVAGTLAARMDQCSLMTRLSVPNIKDGLFIKPNQDYICGRFYAVRKSRLLELMESFGTAKMPKELIHEDAWMQRMLDIMSSRQGGHELRDVVGGKHRLWRVCREAVVFFVPQDWREDHLIKARSLHAEEQLKSLFPDFYAAKQQVASGIRNDPSRRGIIVRAIGSIRERGLRGASRHYVARAIRSLSSRRARKLFEQSRASSIEVTAGQWIRSELSRS
ncbi:MAG: glycosyltransferase family 2 protein [Rhodothermia bacterium]|nr:glycosyltransferase family 2 protein [Rhodothermia bacterium]